MSFSFLPTFATNARGGGFSPRGIRTSLIAGGALLSCVLIASVWGFVETGRENALNDAKRELVSLARALSAETDRTFQGAEILQTAVIERIQAKGVASAPDLAKLAGAMDFQEMLKQRVSDVLYVDALAIFDAHGDMVSDSRAWPAPDLNVADRDYFQALDRDPSLESFVGDPADGKITRVGTIRLAKRISGPNNKFLGVVLVAIKVSYFESAYSTFIMSGGRVSLFRDNGLLLARVPHIDTEFGNTYKSTPLFNGGAPQDDGIVNLRHPRDGRPAIVIGFVRLPHFSLVMAVSKGEAEILAKWNAIARAFCLAAAAMLALIATTALILARLFDQQRKAAEADQAHNASAAKVFAQQQDLKHAARFEVALNNMLHGVAMFDNHSRIIICNQLYAQIYSLPAELARPGADYGDIIAYGLRNIGFRNPADGLQLRGHDLTQTETMEKRELADGRTIQTRSRPLKEGGWIATHEDITEREAAEKRLSHMARHDALTGLPNRILLQERMERAVAGLQDDQGFAVLCLDLDHFKETNDTLGHPVGDAVLKDFAARLQASVKPSDTIARIGGDEFAILRVAHGGAEGVAGFAERLLTVLNEPYEVSGQQINIGASIGIACAPGDGDQGAMLLRKADIALYKVKAEGRRGYRFFEAEMDTELQSRRNLEVEFRRALQEREFEVFYQPLLDARTRTIRSFEALVRWRHPERGLIPPIEFIPLAEETGLIIPLGDWVLRTACREASRWPIDVCISVNLSAVQFKAADLFEKVHDALAMSGLASDRLELEITESALLHDSHRTLEILHQFRAMGIKIAMDDFGTGYSSLSYLRSFPFDKIKIDKSFVQNLDQRDSQAIVRSIASLGRNLAMTTTAEGVETEAQLGEVIAKGCIEVQGYLFSKPVPASDVGGVLRKFHRTTIAA